MKSIKVISIVAVAVVFIVSYYSVAMVRGEGSFLKQIETINQELEKWYLKQSNIAKKMKIILCVSSDANRQSVISHWPRKLMKVLQVATGVSSSSHVDMTQVSRIVTGLRQNIKPIQEDFEDNIVKFIFTKVDHELELDKSFDEKTDLAKFTEDVKDDLCSPFRRENEMNFDFKGAIDDLIETAKAENIVDEIFVEHVIKTIKPIAPLYSAAMVCQLILDGLSENNRVFNLDFSSNNNHGINDWPYADI